MKVILILGSNIGNRLQNLKLAEKLIRKFVGVPIRETEAVETHPFGVKNQPKFLNKALLIDTLHPPFELLSILKWIEKRVGRYRTFRWGPRTIDIDIVLYEYLRIDTPELKVPHPGLAERDFFKSLCLSLLKDYPEWNFGKSKGLPQAVFQKTPEGFCDSLRVVAEQQKCRRFNTDLRSVVNPHRFVSVNRGLMAGKHFLKHPI